MANIKGKGQRLIPEELLEWIKGLNKGEGASLNITTLTDSKGNPRFIEGDGIVNESLPSGYDVSYCKWSLSGTHLMFVVAGTMANTTAVTNNTRVATFNLPSWVLDKIYPVFATNVIETKSIDYRGVGDWSNQGGSAYIGKYTDGIRITSGSITASADRGFRMQFDLLIDTD